MLSTPVYFAYDVFDSAREEEAKIGTKISFDLLILQKKK
jgi:hypothetical protein